MPRLDTAAEARLATWVASIDPQAVRATLREFGIDPKPTLDRLEKLASAPVKHDFLNRFFAGLPT